MNMPLTANGSINSRTKDRLCNPLLFVNVSLGSKTAKNTDIGRK